MAKAKTEGAGFLDLVRVDRSLVEEAIRQLPRGSQVALRLRATLDYDQPYTTAGKSGEAR